MNTFTIILIVSEILLAIFAGFVLSYAKKRGENIATKHDIKSITDKIEEIKLEYSKKLEEYKSELTRKYEIEKIMIDNKTEIFRKLQQLKSAIIKRKNNIGPESELMETIFGLIIEISIQIGSISIFNQSIKDLAVKLTEENNKIVSYIFDLRAKGETKYTWNFDPIDGIIDSLQNEIIK
jgi:hypothetical protein